MKFINLTRGQKAIVDDEMAPLLCQFKWQAAIRSERRGLCYAIKTTRLFPGRDGETTERMHAYVVGRPLKGSGYVVDHINGDTLDNRRENLRVVSSKVNSQNQYRHRNGKAVGVGYMKNINRWRAYSRVGKNNLHLGCFKTQAEAVEAYKKFISSLTCLHIRPDLSQTTTQ